MPFKAINYVCVVSIQSHPSHLIISLSGIPASLHINCFPSPPFSLFCSYSFHFPLLPISLSSLHVSYLDDCISTLTHELKSSGLRERTSQVLQNRALILKINRAENQKEMWGEKDRKRRLRKEQMMERKHEMSYCVTKTTLHA